MLGQTTIHFLILNNHSEETPCEIKTPKCLQEMLLLYPKYNIDVVYVQRKHMYITDIFDR